MAKFVATDVTTTINGTDLSDHIAAVTIDLTSDEIETTAFSSSGYRTRIGGLKDASITIDFHNDFAASSVDSTIWSNFGSLATVVVKPTSGSVTSTNPSYTGVFLVSQHQFASTVGDLATVAVTWPSAGTAGVTRGTA